MKMRLGKLRAQFRERDIDGFIIASYENRYYMSGFSGTAGTLVISADDAVLITDFRYVEQAKAQAPEFRVIMHKGPMVDTVKEVVAGMGLKRVGFESARITFSEYALIRDALEGVELVPEKDVVESLRMIKSDEEIALIAEACRITDAAFDHILGYIKPGVTESEIANELVSFMVKHDVKPSFDFIVASGERSALPHGVASDKIIEPGDFVTLDFGGFYRRYTSDMTRTVVVGTPTEEQKAIYDLVLRAQLESIDAAKAGTTGKEVDSVARGIIEDAGHGEHFGHGLGHSVGLEIHENPRFSPADSSLIEPGMVLSVEPGVYVPGWGGVRIEDLVVITDGEARVLSSSPKNLIQL
ncbi:MAG TPA: Xaa-Pro peptidase family protein [Armatimonadota bacterium]|jgi:Xaa-Pro aminopeptidase|nr:Xaa-Pro peptidase family protein [Bacillota bacterium]HPP75948.1 Xaa-Pro peptidase family protein [Armatimonadota bacterium]HPZ13665.1 Xaa-Pro peptidase family protein [Bacillota bacterium]